MKAIVLCCVVVLLAQLSAAHVQDVIRMIQQPRELERYKTNGKDSRLSAFSWSNCGSASDPVQLKNFTLSPDPVKLPGNINVSVGAQVGVTLTSPVELDLSLKKKTFLGWITIPCVDDIGSCNYPDACALLANITCPPVFQQYHIPCHCPIAQATYYLPTITVAVPLPPDVPSWLDDGDYEVQATMKASGKELACIKVNLSIAKGG